MAILLLRPKSHIPIRGLIGTWEAFLSMQRTDQEPVHFSGAIEFSIVQFEQ